MGFAVGCKKWAPVWRAEREVSMALLMGLWRDCQRVVCVVVIEWM